MNGLPDDLEDDTLDLDNNDIPDSQEDRNKSILTKVGNCSIGISYAAQGSIKDIEAMDSIDHTTISSVVRPYDMPIGLVGFRLLVSRPGDTASVTLHFCRAMPEDMTWYNFNSVDGWSDYSEHVVFSSDRKALQLELVDGGRGDADGVANGIIVDPGGSGIATFIEGLVFDADTDQGIDQAYLYMDDAILQTFSDGRYLSMILPGQYPIIAYAQGYEPQFNDIQVPEAAVVTNNIGLKPVRGNSKPMALITSPGSSSMTIKAGEALVFRCCVINGDGSLTYQWRFGGGAADSNDEYPGIVTFNKGGTYEVSLTVWDEDRDTGKDTMLITVEDTPQPAPGNGGGSGGGGGGGCFLSTIFDKR
jgi:hypothetical protein